MHDARKLIALRCSVAIGKKGTLLAHGGRRVRQLTEGHAAQPSEQAWWDGCPPVTHTTAIAVEKRSGTQRGEDET